MEKMKYVCGGCGTKHLDQLESKNILVLRGILSFREDYSRSAFPNGNNLTNESNILVTISERKMRHQFERNPLVLRLLFFWVNIVRMMQFSSGRSAFRASVKYEYPEA